MAFYCYSHAAMEADLSTNTFKVYHVLAKHANNKTRDCFLRKEVIAKDLKVCWRTVHRAIKELVKVGVISFKASFGRFSTFQLKERTKAAHPAKDYILAAQNHQFFSKIMRSLNKICSMQI